jgi:hypothetical protein
LQHPVRIFVVPAPSTGGAPYPVPAIVVDGASLDVARAAARTQLEVSGFRVRSLNFGGEGLIAYVEERAQ